MVRMMRLVMRMTMGMMKMVVVSKYHNVRGWSLIEHQYENQNQ